MFICFIGWTQKHKICSTCKTILDKNRSVGKTNHKNEAEILKRYENSLHKFHRCVSDWLTMSPCETSGFTEGSPSFTKKTKWRPLNLQLQKRSHIQRQKDNTVLYSQICRMQNIRCAKIVPVLLDVFIYGCKRISGWWLYFNWRNVMTRCNSRLLDKKVYFHTVIGILFIIAAIEKQLVSTFFVLM